MSDSSGNEGLKLAFMMPGVAMSERFLVSFHKLI